MGWNLLWTETIVAQENCGNNWLDYIWTVVQFGTVAMRVYYHKVKKCKCTRNVMIQEHWDLTKKPSLTPQTLHKDSTFWKTWHTETYTIADKIEIIMRFQQQLVLVICLKKASYCWRNLIHSNHVLVSENEKLQQLQEGSNKSNFEALQQIEKHLQNGDNGAKVRWCQYRRKQRAVVVPPACRVSRRT